MRWTKTHTLCLLLSVHANLDKTRTLLLYSHLLPGHKKVLHNRDSLASPPHLSDGLPEDVVHERVLEFVPVPQLCEQEDQSLH